MELIDKKSLERLSFYRLINHTQPLSAYGRKILVDLTPFLKGQEKELELEFDRLESLAQYIQNHSLLLEDIEHHLSALKNIRPLLENCLRHYILDEVDCFEIKNQALIMEQLRTLLSSDILASYHLKSLQNMIKLLDPNDEKTVSFHFYNAYSKMLARVREDKKSIEKKIFHAPSEEKKKQLLLERSSILAQEEREEYQVRVTLSNKIEEYISDFLYNIDQIAQFDFSLAKVKFAEKYHCIRPLIDSTNVTIKGKGFVNIRVKELLESQDQVYTPIDIALKSGTTVITGANMGGKSVTLSTIVENLLLFHYGFFVAAEEASFSLMEFIQFISDDMQDVTQGISSFGAEIYKLKSTYPHLKTEQCFIVFDEFARGTNPQEGQIFVKSLISYLNRFSSISLITSHFDGVIHPDAVHYQIIGLKNIDTAQLQKKISLGYSSLNVIQEYMDYRLEKTENKSVPKDALHVAQLIGLDKELEEIIQQEYEKELKL